MKIAVDTVGITNGDMDLSVFKEFGEAVYFGTLPREEQKKLFAECDVVLVNKVVMDKEILSACPKLKYIGVFATGYNVVDIEECRACGITVTNVPGYSTNSVCQHVFALLLAAYSKIPEYTASVAAGDWVKSKTFCYFPWGTYELYGKTFGILGYGNIGRAVAKVADALGLNVVISTRTPPENCPYKLMPFEEMLRVSDVVSLHCPQTAETAGIINARTLSLMKDGAVLINTARGGLIDERALRDALDSGKLSCACLDVLSAEPMRADNPLLGAKNCLITPHIAWVPYETRCRLIAVGADNLRAFLKGTPQNVVS